MSQKSAIITNLLNSQFSVATKFDYSPETLEQLRTFFRSQPKSFWDFEKKLWYMPKCIQEVVCSYLTEQGFEVTINEFTPKLYIHEKGDVFEIRLGQNDL